MATCNAETLLQSAADSGFTKLSAGDAFSVMAQLCKSWAGSSDDAETILEASKDSGFTKLSPGDAWSVMAQLYCEISI